MTTASVKGSFGNSDRSRGMLRNVWRKIEPLFAELVAVFSHMNLQKPV